MEKAELTPLVLEALRQKPQMQYNDLDSLLAKLTPDYDDRRDALKVSDVIWDLILQGLVAPGVQCSGMGSSALRLPFIHVTDYGMRCLEADAVMPHDPDRYLDRLEQLVGQQVDDVLFTYVREGLLTFLGGHYLAATVMLGVASEQCIDLLIEAYSQAIAEPTHQLAFQRKVKQAGRSVKRRFDVLRDELLVLALPAELKDALDIQLSGVFTLIRYTRNDAGHPTGATVDRDTAHANLLLFPRYCKRVYDLIGYFQTSKV